MARLDALNENFRFMVLEVTGQVEQTRRFLDQPGRDLLDKINSRDDYIDNLKSHIEDNVFDALMGLKPTEKSLVNRLRALTTISSNLERIADFAVNILRQTQHLTDFRFIQDYNHPAFFDEVLAGLTRIAEALDRRNLPLALRICQCEFNLDDLYKIQMQRILTELKTGREAGNLLTTVLILRYLERMGDSLLNIGEAIIFALIGEKLKIHQYRALHDNLAASGLSTPLSEVDFESIWGTRSGCRIGTVQEKTPQEPARPVLFKEGKTAKLEREKRNLERWERLIPGLPPKIMSFQTGEDDSASMLLEYLPGCTFQDMVVNGPTAAAQNAVFILEETLEEVWKTTLRPDPVKAGFLKQIRDRSESVFRLHPRFRTRPGLIGGLKIPSFEELAAAVEPLEKDLPAPFSVLIHGDLNINNIIYEPAEERLHFVDLHRSAETDFVQDVSVFLISNFRLPVFGPTVRDRINRILLEFLGFAKEFAQAHDDPVFEARLALGLARSFFTSTRFELNQKFAKRMQLRAVYLLEKLAGFSGRPWEEFRLPADCLIY